MTDRPYHRLITLPTGIYRLTESVDNPHPGLSTRPNKWHFESWPKGTRLLLVQRGDEKAGYVWLYFRSDMTTHSSTCVILGSPIHPLDEKTEDQLDALAPFLGLVPENELTGSDMFCVATRGTPLGSHEASGLIAWLIRNKRLTVQDMADYAAWQKAEAT